jgi:integrase
MNAELAKSLRLWKMKTIYNRPGDWVYASPAKKGTQPYWPKSIYRVYIKRAADKIGLRKHIGWPTFRHTFGTILNANGENPKVIQELMRHANLKVTRPANTWKKHLHNLVLRLSLFIRHSLDVGVHRGSTPVRDANSFNHLQDRESVKCGKVLSMPRSS